MLVLGRKPNQKIFIGENIVVTIASVKGNLVKVGIEAPQEIQVVREEAKEKGK